jgi:hypothetical protein
MVGRSIWIAVLVALAACSSGGGGSAATTAPSTVATTVTSTTVAAAEDGCRLTPIKDPPKPAWAPTAPDTRWVADDASSIAGFLFADPLRAGHPENPANKILWVVNGPRDGSPLEIELHPVSASLPKVMASFPANSSPGEIYPSIVEVPAPGCWRATLRWNGRTAQLDLRFV